MKDKIIGIIVFVTVLGAIVGVTQNAKADYAQEVAEYEAKVTKFIESMPDTKEKQRLIRLFNNGVHIEVGEDR